MFRKLGGAFLSTLLAALLALPPSLSAWGNTGHEAVAYVAWQQLTPETRARVSELLKNVPPIQTDSSEIPGYLDWVAQLPSGLSDDEKNEYLFMRAATWADSIKHHGLQDSDIPPPGVVTERHIGFGHHN